MKDLHVGEFLKDIAAKKRMSAPEIAEKINMSAQGVREIFKKRDLHMKNIEDFSRLFNINLYRVLSNLWEGKELPGEDLYITNIQKNTGENFKIQQTPISVTFQIDPAKKDALIRLITE